VIGDVNRRLGLTGEMLEEVAGKYLRASNFTGEAIDVNTTSAAFSAFKLSGNAVSDALDALYSTSQATGVSINTLAGTAQGAAYDMQNLGFSFEETIALAGQFDKVGIDSGSAFSNMRKGLVSLSRAGEEPQEAFRRVTSSIQDLVSAGDIAGAIDLSGEFFGARGAAQFVGAIQSGALALDDMVGQIGSMDSKIMDAGTGVSTLAGAWQLVKNNAQIAFEPLAADLFSGLGDTIKAAMPYIQSFGSWVSDHIGWIKKMAVVIGVMTAAIWVLNIAMSANPVVLIIAAIMVAIALLYAGFFWLWENVEGFRNFFLTAWELMKGGASVVADWFNNTLVPFFQKAWDAIKSAISVTAKWFQDRWNDIKMAAQRVGDFFVNDIPNAFNRGKQLILDKVDALKTGVIGTFEKLRDGAASVLDGIREAAATPINFVIETVYNNGLRKLIQGVLDLFKIDSVKLPELAPIKLARGAMMGDGNRPILWNEVPGQREAYIPINQSSRSHALWLETGRQLGAIPMAKGGIWPSAGIITSPYGYRVGPFFGAEMHDGVDIGAPSGTPVVAILPGLISFAGNYDGYGNTVKIDHGDGLVTFYAHLSAINAQLGQMVDQGALIGAVGSTGFSTGPHLHFGASLNGGSIDPSGIVSGSISASGSPGGSGNKFSILSGLTGFISKLKEIGETPFAKTTGGAAIGMINHVKDYVNDKLFGWLPGHNNAPSQGGDFEGWWAEAINVAGPQWEQYKNAVRQVAQHESGMDPNAANNWDSNAKAGIPSKGLMQFIEPTFKSYAWPGHTNWLSPVDQILAFFKYVPARYGSIWNHPGLRGLASGSGYVGYDSGGWLKPGATLTANMTGSPEAVLTYDQWSRVASMITTLQVMMSESQSNSGRPLTVRLTDDQLERLIDRHPTIGRADIHLDDRSSDDLISALEVVVR